MIASTLGKVGYVGEGTILYRQHASNAVGSQSVKGVSSILKKMKEGSVSYQLQVKDRVNEANTFYHLYGNELSEQQKKTFSFFCNLFTYHKLNRIYLYHKYGI